MVNKKVLTIVIASLGKKNINSFLKNLVDINEVSKIIVSVPNNCNLNNVNYKNYKIKVLLNPFKHQVMQRLSSLSSINTKLTLFIDDDLTLNRSEILKLIKSKFKMGNSSVIGPVYYDDKSEAKIHDNSNNAKNFIKKIVHFLLFFSPISSKRMGTISRAGNCYGMDPDFMKKEFEVSSWVPGGCFIIDTNRMVKKNYFNSKGKAYCEDLVLSKLLVKKNLKIFINKNCKVYTDPPQKIISKKDVKNYIDGLEIFFKNEKKTLNFLIYKFFLRFRSFFNN